MKILVVDDSPSTRMLLKAALEKQGYTSVLLASSAVEALDLLSLDGSAPRRNGVDLVLMDIVMPKMDGIEATRQIKSSEELRDIPVIMVTGNTDCHNLEKAFEAGAMDFIKKPVNKLELQSRVRSVLHLKAETDRRKAREKELIKVTKKLESARSGLESLARLDQLTGVANRRYHDEIVESEWRRARRDGKPLTYLIADIDHFKVYNDSFGHQKGDGCLKAVVGAIAAAARRPGDMVARYGGDVFAAILPGVAKEGAALLAERYRKAAEELYNARNHSPVLRRITISVGAATVIPDGDNSPPDLLRAADKALNLAKLGGRNKVVICDDIAPI